MMFECTWQGDLKFIWEQKGDNRLNIRELIFFYVTNRDFELKFRKIAEVYVKGWSTIFWEMTYHNEVNSWFWINSNVLDLIAIIFYVFPDSVRNQSFLCLVGKKQKWVVSEMKSDIDFVDRIRRYSQSLNESITLVVW